MVTTRKGEEISRKRKEIEAHIWEMRRQDSDSSESEGDCVRKLSPKRRKSTTTVHLSDRSKKFPSLEIVPPKSSPSGRSNKSQQAQAKIDSMNQHASRQTNPRVIGIHPIAESDQEAEGSDGDRLGAKSTSTVSGSDSEATESDGDRLGAKSASTVSESDQEVEDSDGDCVRQKTQEIVPPKGCAQSRVVHPSDRMKKFREKQADIDRMNPHASSPPHRPYNKTFLTENNRFRFDIFWEKGVVDQRLVDLGSFASLGVEQVLKDNHLLSTVTCVEPYVLEVVMEFYANLPSKETNRLVQKIFLRGQMYEFSPKLINDVLDLRGRRITRAKETLIDVDLNRIAASLTGGRIKQWKKITPACLSPLVAALHVICCANWIPTSNTCTLSVDRANFLYMLVKKTPFNFGKLAYDQIIRMGRMVDSKFKPVLPALIYQVLNFQRAILLRKGESLSQLAKPICYHVRLSKGKHVSLPSTSGRKGNHVSLPSASSRKEKHVSLISPSIRKAKLKAYVDKAMAILHFVNDNLDDNISGDKETDDDAADDISGDEETDDDAARTE